MAKIEIPDELAVWLEKVSKRFATTPTNFIVNILLTYKEVYKAGLEEGAKVLDVLREIYKDLKEMGEICKEGGL